MSYTDLDSLYGVSRHPVSLYCQWVIKHSVIYMYWYRYHIAAYNIYTKLYTRIDYITTCQWLSPNHIYIINIDNLRVWYIFTGRYSVYMVGSSYKKSIYFTNTLQLITLIKNTWMYIFLNTVKAVCHHWLDGTVTFLSFNVANFAIPRIWWQMDQPIKSL